MTPAEVVTLHHHLTTKVADKDDETLQDMMSELRDVLVAIKSLSDRDAQTVRQMLVEIGEASVFETLRVAAKERLAAL